MKKRIKNIKIFDVNKVDNDKKLSTFKILIADKK